MEAGAGAFQFTQFEWIGFDMDHTLVRYKNDNLLKLCYDCCLNYLVEEKHYDPCIRDELKFDPTFLIKGTIADKENGNFLKLDHRRKVIRATHGTTPLTPEEIAKIYPDPVNFTGTTTAKFWLCTSYFEMSFINAYAMLITWIDARIAANNGSTKLTKAQWYKKINRDVFRALVFNFGGAWDRGWYFSEIFREPSKYLEDCSGTRKWLTELRARGVKLFMVTNSDRKYADALMNHCFGTDWQSLFSSIVVSARKPHFWVQKDRPFYAFDGETVNTKDAITDLKPNTMYNGGNVFQLMKSLMPDKNKICYFGDDLLSDLMGQKGHCGWHTVAVVEELQPLEKEQHDKITRAAVIPPTAVAERNSIFGSFFFNNEDPSELSYWGSVFHHYSDFYVPFLSAFGAFDVDTVYRSHERGSPKNGRNGANTVRQHQISTILDFDEAKQPDVAIIVPQESDMVNASNYLQEHLASEEGDVENLHLRRS